MTFEPLKPRYGASSERGKERLENWAAMDPDLPAKGGFEKHLQESMMKASAQAFEVSLVKFMRENDVMFEEMFSSPEDANRVTWMRALLRAISESEEEDIYFLVLWMAAIDFGAEASIPSVGE